MAQATSSRSRAGTERPQLAAGRSLAAFGIEDSRLVLAEPELPLSERQVSAAGQRAHLTRARAVDTNVNHIPRRLRSAVPDWDYIHTHFGHGHRLEPEPDIGGRGKGRAR
jgi:hypothetical protein